jgi:hypothetical protein
MIGNKLFKNYFNRYDKNDVLHDGFIQSMNFSAYTDLTMLNDLSSVIIDSYLYNELKNRIMLSRWKKFLTWDETKKDFIIDPTFYTDAVVALYVYLAKSQKFFDILTANFSSLSATELEQINHGSRSTGRVYGEALKTNVYDKVTVELMRGTETENRGTHTDSKSYGAHTDTETHATYTDTVNEGAYTDTETHAQYTETENKGLHTDTETKGAHTDTETKGAHTDSETRPTYTDTDNVGTHTDQENKGAQSNSTTTTNSVYPYDASAFVPDTKTEEGTSLGAQNNSTVYGAQVNSTVHGEQVVNKSFAQQVNTTQYAEQINTTGYGAQENTTTHGQQQITNVNGAQSQSNVYGAQEITNAYGAQSNSEIYGAQENTKSFGKTTNETKTRTDTETKGAHTDNETVSAFIDTKSRTKVILLSPDKYFEIQKELAEKNVYTLFAEAIDACFLNDNFEFQALEKWGCII